MTELFSQIAAYLPAMLRGLGVSLLLLVTLVAVGTPLAFILAAAQRNRVAAIRWIAIVFVEIARGMPSLILLYLVYFGLPTAGITLTSFAAAAVALSINYAGYVSETIKSGLDALPRGQMEAAHALGLGWWATTRYVVIPQSTRIITPPLLSWIIVYFQTTSIGFAISVPELMSEAYSIAALNFEYLTVFIIAGLLYAIISIPGSLFVSRLEARRGD